MTAKTTAVHYSVAYCCRQCYRLLVMGIGSALRQVWVGSIDQNLLDVLLGPRHARPDREVFRLRVVDDDRRGALLRYELERLGQRDADLLGRQNREELGVLLQVGAGRVAPRVALALLAREPKPLPDDPVGIFGQRLRQRDAQTVDV